jgi:hypothetical protein
MSNVFKKIIHEEPMDKLTIESIGGGNYVKSGCNSYCIGYCQSNCSLNIGCITNVEN